MSQLSHSLHADRVGFVRVYRQADAESMQQIRCCIYIGPSCDICPSTRFANYDAESLQQTRFDIYFVITCDIRPDIRCKNHEQQQM